MSSNKQKQRMVPKQQKKNQNGLLIRDLSNQRITSLQKNSFSGLRSLKNL